MNQTTWSLNKLPFEINQSIKEFAAPILCPLILKVRTERDVSRIYKQSVNTSEIKPWSRGDLGSLNGCIRTLNANESVDFLKNACLLLKHACNDLKFNENQRESWYEGVLDFGSGNKIITGSRVCGAIYRDFYVLMVEGYDIIQMRIENDTLQIVFFSKGWLWEPGSLRDTPASSIDLKKQIPLIQVFIKSVFKHCEENETYRCKLRIKMFDDKEFNWKARFCPKLFFKVEENLRSSSETESVNSNISSEG
jgi:hypothetical protein